MKKVCECGKKLDERINYCVHCGKELNKKVSKVESEKKKSIKSKKYSPLLEIFKG